MVDVPDRLLKKLESDKALHAAVNTALSSFAEWPGAGEMLFFPDYTVHGPEHIQMVLGLAEVLIKDEAWPVLTAADCAVLILAVLVHDMAMHLRPDGFVALVRSERKDALIPKFDQGPWPQLWEEYILLARRWNEQQLVRIFGDTEPVHGPDLDKPQHWTERHRRLIGEFLRHHHPRIAHEIAFHGMPGRDPRDRLSIKLPGNVETLADVAGLVARSHGTSLRRTFDYPDKGDHRTRRGTHAIFLMAVLRIADYLHLHAERAPGQRLNMQRLSSPLSRREWAAHNAIDEIAIHTQEDPEALRITVVPNRLNNPKPSKPDATPSKRTLEEATSIGTYLRIREWLEGIQRELDHSWAVLGEAYGRFESNDERLNMAHLKLAVRRVNSNLFEPTFADRLEFVPERAAFDTAGGELMKLLVGPLYGDRPEIGIRELMQNSVDAIRELREYYNQTLGHWRDADWPMLSERHPDDLADVIISLWTRDDTSPSEAEGGPPRDWEYWVEVKDRGIGMTAATVRDYLLKAGASLRTSEAWRKRFVEPDEAAPHARVKSKVFRSGRFGVGIFAAFLLGPEIEVTTRYVESRGATGIRLRATLETENIELRVVPVPTTGTTIRVRVVEPDILIRLVEPHPLSGIEGERFDWYCLDEPRVLRILEPGHELLKQRYHLPSPSSRLPMGWLTITHRDFQKIHSTYLPDTPDLVCNGIPLREYDAPWLSVNEVSVFRAPALSVFDPDARLPVSLDRETLTHPLPFVSQMHTAALLSTLAWFLVFTPPGLEDDQFAHSVRTLLHCGPRIHGDKSRSSSPALFLHQGVSLLDPWHLSCLRVSRILLMHPGSPSLISSYPPNLVPFALFPCCSAEGMAVIPRLFSVRAERPASQAPLKGFRMYVRQSVQAMEHFVFFGNSFLRRVLETFLGPVEFEKELDVGLVYKGGACDDAHDAGIDLELFHGAFAAYLDYRQSPAKLSLIARIWKQYIGAPFIPYDVEERRANLAHAFENRKLKPYIRMWEEMKQLYESTLFQSLYDD